MSRPTLIFLHNYRCAGNMVNHALMNTWKLPQFWKLGELTGQQFSYDDFLKVAHTPQTTLFLGHFYYGAHRHIDRPAAYFTNLRPPVERMVSGYRQWADSGNSFADWLRNHHEFDNGMTRRLSGVGLPPNQSTGVYDYTLDENLDGDFKVDKDIFERAKATLLEPSTSILLPSRMEESLVLMEQRHNLPPIADAFAVKFNKSLSQGLFPQTIPQTFRDEINTQNTYDLALLELAKKRLESELAAASPQTHENIRIRRLLTNVFGSTQSGDLLNAQQTWDLNLFSTFLTSALNQLNLAGFDEDVGRLTGLILENLCTSDEITNMLAPQLIPNMSAVAKQHVDAALERRNRWKNMVAQNSA